MQTTQFRPKTPIILLKIADENTRPNSPRTTTEIGALSSRFLARVVVLFVFRGGLTAILEPQFLGHSLYEMDRPMSPSARRLRRLVHVTAACGGQGCSCCTRGEAAAEAAVAEEDVFRLDADLCAALDDGALVADVTRCVSLCCGCWECLAFGCSRCPVLQGVGSLWECGVHVCSCVQTLARSSYTDKAGHCFSS